MSQKGDPQKHEINFKGTPKEIQKGTRIARQIPNWKQGKCRKFNSMYYFLYTMYIMVREQTLRYL